MKATLQDGTYPRPMLLRDAWVSLDGTWDFAHDDSDIGRSERWFSLEGIPFTSSITVPFPPESPASGIADTGFHPVVWYRRVVSHDLLAPNGTIGQRILLHFGAVDYRASVWCDGQLVATHIGGQTPFTADLTDALATGAVAHTIVVRAEDDPQNFEQPRGKQDWRETTHGIWYERTTGIWQTVWAESVPSDHIVEVGWIADVAAGVIHGEVFLAQVPTRPLTLELTFSFGEEILARQSIAITNAATTAITAFDLLRNGQERARLQWSPDNPNLIDVTVIVRDSGSSAVVDEVASYLGLRTAAVGGGSFILNDQPIYVRSVLDQGYRPETHIASRDTTVLRGEVEMIKAMGFNTVRTHQKAEDPRFLFWADRLGLMVWGETAAAYEFSPTAVALLLAEWGDLVRRDRNHPSIVVWVPVNESWGVQDIATSRPQQQYALALANLTRALDPTRPVVTNEGWEHVDSDILGLHDYSTDPAELRRRYSNKQDAIDMVLSAHGPSGRRPIVAPAQIEKFLAGDAPLMITEFGGISMSTEEAAWGYGTVTTAAEYGTLLLGLFDALRSGRQIVGFCYTQFMDTGQETNGLLYADGSPKLPLADIHHIVTGLTDGSSGAAGSTFGWTD